MSAPAITLGIKRRAKTRCFSPVSNSAKILMSAGADWLAGSSTCPPNSAWSRPGRSAKCSPMSERGSPCWRMDSCTASTRAVTRRIFAVRWASQPVTKQAAISAASRFHQTVRARRKRAARGARIQGFGQRSGDDLVGERRPGCLRPLGAQAEDGEDQVLEAGAQRRGRGERRGGSATVIGVRKNSVQTPAGSRASSRSRRAPRCGSKRNTKPE